MKRYTAHRPSLRNPVTTVYTLVLAVSLLLAHLPALALEPVNILGEGDSLSLGPYLEYMKDPYQSLSLADVRARNEQFRPHDSEVLNVGYTSAGHWVRFRLSNPGPRPVERYLEFRSLFADRLNLYQPQGAGEYEPVRSGRLVPPDQRPRPARNFVFPITLAPESDRTYYLYVDSADTLTIPLYLHTNEGLQQTELTSRSWLTFYQGLIVTMTVFSLFLLVILRDPVYGYYIGVIVVHQGLFFTLFNGLGYHYFGLENPWWSREALSVLVALAMWMIMQFTRVLLDTANQQPRLNKLVVAVQAAALVIAALSLFLEYFVSIRLANPLASVTALILWIVGWNSLRKGNPAARYFLIAWTTLIIGGLAYSLKSWGLVPSNLLTEHGWQIGAAIEAIFLSLAIANRISTESRQRMQLQSQAQKAQAQALEIQRRANETLEQNVRERTEELRQANRQLQRLSDTDQLTEISNRRALERYLQHTFERAAVSKTSIAVLMIDVDHFKPVNDTHGHPVGDDCLKVIATRIQRSTRWPADMVARYGGEEFCVVLPDGDCQTAMAAAERIRAGIASESVPTRTGPLRLTVSVGVYAAVPVAGDSAEDFLQRADDALYCAKHEGRNRVSERVPEH